jgi:hypothetical protein
MNNEGGPRSVDWGLPGVARFKKTVDEHRNLHGNKRQAVGAAKWFYYTIPAQARNTKSRRGITGTTLRTGSIVLPQPRSLATEGEAG